jgi:hypothetical protein
MVSRCQTGQLTDQQSTRNTLRKRIRAFDQQHLRKKMALSRLTRCLPHHTSMSIYNERHLEKQILACNPHSWDWMSPCFSSTLLLVLWIFLGKFHIVTKNIQFQYLILPSLTSNYDLQSASNNNTENYFIVTSNLVGDRNNHYENTRHPPPPVVAVSICDHLGLWRSRWSIIF